MSPNTTPIDPNVSVQRPWFEVALSRSVPSSLAGKVVLVLKLTPQGWVRGIA